MNYKFTQAIKYHEGVVHHMYLDTVGKVTIGVGNMLPNVSAAIRLFFVQRETGAPAAKEEITREFNYVRCQKIGMRASWYQQFTALELPNLEIERLLQQRLREFEQGLLNNFADYYHYPLKARYALLDMAFNLGLSGLLSKFPRMIKAVRGQNWSKAAKESHRPQVSKSRNYLIKQWLEQAALDAVRHKKKHSFC